MEHEGKPAGYWPLLEDSRKVMKETFHYVNVIIIDKVSVVSSLTLAYIHMKLDGGNLWRKGMIRIHKHAFVGNILQLQPVNDQPVFEQIVPPHP